MHDFFSIPVVYIICKTRPDQQKSAKHYVFMYCVWEDNLENLLKLNFHKKIREKLIGRLTVCSPAVYYFLQYTMYTVRKTQISITFALIL